MGGAGLDRIKYEHIVRRFSKC